MTEAEAELDLHDQFYENEFLLKEALEEIERLELWLSEERSYNEKRRARRGFLSEKFAEEALSATQARIDRWDETARALGEKRKDLLAQMDSDEQELVRNVWKLAEVALPLAMPWLPWRRNAKLDRLPDEDS